MNSTDSKYISEEAKNAFAESADRYKRATRIKGLIGVFLALTFTYGILVYFMFKTFLDALGRV